ncbi:MAG: hypothetical protein HOE10_02125 [Deltaproteobacteria bacterium]|nr:hypothetical protein [Deltaproteobacteria bacterium]
MTSLANNPQVEENYYQILEVSKTASLVEIRDAYESKLEETQLDAFAAYSLFPEDETEEILLYFSQAFVTLANPVARAKYDDELQHGMVSAEMQTVIEKEDLTKIKSLYSKKSVNKKTKTVPSAKKRSEEEDGKEDEIKVNFAKEIRAESQEERRDQYLSLAIKNELSEEKLEEFYSTFRTHGSKLSYNGTVLQQIRKIKSVTLEELAQITCIRITYLKAIEDENFSIFSSEIYLKGYLLCYVEALQLPKEQVLKDYIILYKNSF